MKRMLSAVTALLCILPLLCGLGCSAGDFPTAETIASYLNKTGYLKNNLSASEAAVSAWWDSSELKITDVSAVRKSKGSDGETAAVGCKITAENEIFKLVRYLDFSCKTELGGWSVESFAPYDTDKWELALTIPDGKNEIEENLFSGFTELTSVTVPDSVIDLGAGAFENCVNLQYVKMSAEVAVFPTAVFKNCPRLETIELSENTEVFMMESFKGCTALRFKKMPDYLIFVGTDAFADCPNLISALEIPAYTQGIMKGAFRNCTAIKSLKIGKSVQEIDASAFEGCTALSSVSVSSENIYLKTEGKSLVYAADGTVILQTK